MTRLEALANMRKTPNFDWEITILRWRVAKLDPEKDADAIKRLQDEIGGTKRAKWAWETDDLLARATKRGIELPRDKDHWWWSDADYAGENARSYLTDIGKAGAQRLIRDDRRSSLKWWIDVCVPIFTALTGLAGAAIGIIALVLSIGSGKASP